MKSVALLLLACCALSLVPGVARGDDPFADYRIPDHSWRSASASLSANASQLRRQAGYQRDDRSLSSTAAARFDWERDSEPLAAWYGVGAQGSADRTSNRYDQSIWEQLQKLSDGRESWNANAGARIYPGGGPVGWQLSAWATGSYEQDLNRRESKLESFGFPFGHVRQTSRQFQRVDYYSTSLSAQFGPVLGHVRDATPVYDVRVLEDRLRGTGAIEGPLPARTRGRLAAVLAAGQPIGAVHDRPARFLWREVERVLREDSVLVERGLGAFAALRAAEPTAPRSRFQRLRGRLAGPLLIAATGRATARYVLEQEDRLYLADTLYDSIRRQDSIPAIRSLLDQYWAGGQVELHQPLGWNWQLDVAGQAAASIRTGTHGFQYASSAALGWDVADRWSAQALVQQQRLDMRPTDVRPAWAVQYQVSLAYYLEDRVSISLGANEYQARWMSGGEYIRQRQAVLGLSYRFLGALDAPGLMQPMRPLR